MAGLKTKGAVEACVIYDPRRRDETRRDETTPSVTRTGRNKTPACGIFSICCNAKWVNTCCHPLAKKTRLEPTAELSTGDLVCRVAWLRKTERKKNQMNNRTFKRGPRVIETLLGRGDDDFMHHSKHLMWYCLMRAVLLLLSGAEAPREGASVCLAEETYQQRTEIPFYLKPELAPKRHIRTSSFTVHTLFYTSH